MHDKKMNRLLCPIHSRNKRTTVEHVSLLACFEGYLFERNEIEPVNHRDMERWGGKYYILYDANQWPLTGVTMFNFLQEKMDEN